VLVSGHSVLFSLSIPNVSKVQGFKMTMTDFSPITGCASTTKASARDYHGRWFLVDLEDNSLQGDTLAALKSVNVDVKFGYLVLTAQGMLRLDIVLDVIEDDESVQRTAYLDGQPLLVVDEGDLAATWFEHVLGCPCRLVKRINK
jgi:hypothetical protein